MRGRDRLRYFAPIFLWGFVLAPPSARSFVALAPSAAGATKKTLDEQYRSFVALLHAETRDDALAPTKDMLDNLEVDYDGESSRLRERNTLFIGNLPFETSETELKDLFAKYGTVESVSIPVYRETGKSRGFAFVDMGCKEEMQRAIDDLQGSEFEGRTIRVTVSLPREEAKKQAKKVEDADVQKIYVGNLPFTATRKDIEELYSKYGNVKDTYFPMNPETGEPRGFAFVTLDQESAKKAIENTNGLEFLGRPLSVSLPLPPGGKANRRKREPRQKLYVGNLSFYTAPDTLRELFEEFGIVHDCYMPEDPETGGYRGFGFVTLDKEASDTAVTSANGIELDGRIIRVNAAQPKGYTNRATAEDGDNDQDSLGGDIA